MANNSGSHSGSEDNDYFDSLYEWTRRKHDVLQKYAETFAKIKKNLYCVDAFAGRGQHRDGNSGSPLITASIAQRFQDEGREYWLRCINVEKNPEHFQNLEAITVQYSQDLVQNILGDFAGCLAYIMRKLGQTPALFFLDPFGVDGIEWDRLQPILERRETTELLINFNVRYIPRLAGHLGSEAPAARAKTKLLTEVLGTDEWKRYVTSVATSSNAEQATTVKDEITSLYKRQLRQHFKYVYHYPIRSAADGHVRYYLVFATRNPKGVIVMNDILCGTEEQYQEDFESLRVKPLAEQLSLFDTPDEASDDHSQISPEKIVAARGAQLKEAICSTLQTCPQRRTTYLLLRCALAEQFFAKVKRSTYSQPLRELQSEHRINWANSTSKLPDDDDIIHLL